MKTTRPYTCLLAILFLVNGFSMSRASLLVHPNSLDAVRTATVPITANLDDNSQAHINVDVWSMSNGSTEFTLDVRDLRFEGPCTNLAASSASQVITLMGNAAFAKLNEIGVLQHDDGSWVAKMWIVNAVSRSGSSYQTSFQPCSTYNWAFLRYDYAVTQGSVTSVTRIPQGSGTVSQCEETQIATGYSYTLN